MKFINILLLLSETIFLVFIGIISNVLNFSIALNLGLCIFLIFQILLIVKISYNQPTNVHKNSKYLAVLSFVILGLCYFTMMIAKSSNNVPYIYKTLYEFLMGYLVLNGCLMMSKYKSQNTSSKTLRNLGFLLFFISVTVGFLALFGLADFT